MKERKNLGVKDKIVIEKDCKKIIRHKELFDFIYKQKNFNYDASMLPTLKNEKNLPSYVK